MVLDLFGTVGDALAVMVMAIRAMMRMTTTMVPKTKTVTEWEDEMGARGGEMDVREAMTMVMNVLKRRNEMTVKSALEGRPSEWGSRMERQNGSHYADDG
jgi:hypothetical protein